MKALSYNIHSAIGRDRRCDPRRILDIVHSTEAEVVGLQEVDARLRPAQRFDQFDFFCEYSGMECIAGANIIGHRGHYGNALLTKLPVESMRLLSLPSFGAEPRGAILAVLRHKRHRLLVLNTHLGLRRAERREQARMLQDEMSGHEGPTLLIGDFNVWHPNSYVLGVLGAPTERSLAPRTFPSGSPMLALDRIWTRPREALGEVRALRDRLTAIASDHLPVLATLVL